VLSVISVVEVEPSTKLLASDVGS